MADRGRLYKTKGIVLRRGDWGEADRLLTLLTPEYGKLRILAKGVRKPTSRKAGHIELFMEAQFLIARGRNLDMVTQVEALETFRPLREDLARVTYAVYLAELTEYFAEEESEAYGLYALMRESLETITKTADLALLARYFELRLLSIGGYRPELFLCVQCGSPLQATVNFFTPAEGGMLCPRCGESQPVGRAVSVPAQKVLRYLQTRGYDVVRTLQLTGETHQEIEQLMWRYLSYVLERELRSVDFLTKVRRPRLQQAIS
ncbi:MAG: DNA repair protein RecO [Chloroflexi bacterium]|nr:DNA repair protein RecO [Chloroflexota bacterium]